MTADVPADETARTVEQHGRLLLALCLDYYWRENKVDFWEKYRFMALDQLDYLDEKNALAGMTFVDRVGGTDTRPIHRYRFPEQNCALRAADLLTPDGERLGELINIDMYSLTIDIQKSGKTNTSHPSAIFGFDPYRTDALEAALERIAVHVSKCGLDGEGPFRAARRFLLSDPPTLLTGPFDGNLDPKDLVERASHVATELDESVLPVQGPPGSGKTYLGARMVLALVEAGMRVGVSANSHLVIRKLLDEVLHAAEGAGQLVRVAAKPKNKGDLDGSGITECADNKKADAEIYGGIQVFGGTKYLWSRKQLVDSLDVLVVDEASQISLADTLAISSAAKSLIVIGDPQQLDQPQQGSHPPGVASSCLDHVLADHKTIPPDKGIFISQTRRLHPAICRFTSRAFYEDRLTPMPGLEHQVLIDCGKFTGAGLHFVPVNHSGNQSASVEEVAEVSDIYEMLLSGDWRDEHCQVRKLTLDDILIVAPYNAQVGALMEALPHARIGTVDKFQGQEAPIVIYSMATSTPDDAPRGMEFLYSSNRLNVATSRARCVVILVACPALFDVACRTPRQMELSNAFCEFLEVAAA